jgi:hypothetical protein
MIIVCETLIEDERRRNIFGMMSLHMLLGSPGGSGTECPGWLAEVDFRDCRAGPEVMTVGRWPAGADSGEAG